MGLLDGKVVLVTGAARGIGKACAELAAREGARILVNDLGGALDGGDEGASGPADAVVQEIKNAGGEAVANSDSVASAKGAAAMVEQAMDTYGGLNAVINPAGILRDTMFHKMSEADWTAVIDVHLNGSFHVARAAIEHFRNQEDGSFVFFTSTSGLIGNLGQANYAAAKMGIAGLSRIIALEGARKNVRSNAIAPFAWTRMIEAIPIKDEAGRQRVERMKNFMRADQVAQLAVALVAPGAADISGQLFAARGNEVFLMSQSRPVRAMAKAEGWTPETLIDHALPAMKPDMVDLDVTADVFTWDPV